MTIINPNSIAGITSVTAQADIISFYKSNGTPGSLQIDGCNFNTTNGISTFNNLVIGGTLTYEDVKNVDSVGIITARGGLNVTANTDTDTLNVSGISTFGGVLKIPTVAGTNTNADLKVLFQTASGVIDGGSGLVYNPGGDSLSVNGNFINLNTFRGAGALGTLTCANHSSTTGITVSNKIDIKTVDNVAGAFKLVQGSNEYITVDTTNSSEAIKFGTAGSERLRIASNGEITQTAASGNTVITLKRSNTNTTGTVGGINFAALDGHSVASIQARGDGNDEGAHIQFYTTSAAAGDMYNAANIERLRILSGGQVNIGGNYTQTAYMAQVAGDLLLQKAQAAYQHPQLEIYNSNNSGHGGAIKFTGVMSGSKYQQAVIKVYGGSNSTDGSLAFCTGNGGDKVRITSAGYVGINEAAPASMLHITANNDRSSIRLTNTYDTPDNVWELNPGISGVSNTGFCIRDITDSANRFVITGTGNIGFGVNDPAVAGGYHGMEIGGTANTGIRLSATASGSWAFIDYEINGAQKFIVGCKGGDNSWRIATGASLDANVKLIVDSYGRLGIGAIPEAFHSNSKGVIRGDSGYAILGRSDNQLNISQNFYYDSSDAGKYIATGEASLYSQTDGVHKFFTAASGSANASASMQEKLQIQTDGNINFKSTNEPTIRIDSGNSSNSSCLKIEIDGTEEFRIEPGIIDYKNSSNNSRSRLLAANNYYSNTNMFIDLPQWKLSESWHILEVFGTVNPNSSGSGAYVDPCHFYIYRGQGWDGAIKHWLYCASVAPPARHAFPSGTGYAGNAGISAVWYNGSSIVGNMSATSTHYVRLLVPNANNGANFQKNFRVMRRF